MPRSISSAAFALALSSGIASAQSVIHVPGDYPTIQQAIDASSDGDTVLVAPGTYFELIDFGDRLITVTSSDGPASTTIDGQFLGTVVHFGGGSTRQAVINGFTLTHGSGKATAGGVEADGGAPTISGNVIAENLGEGSGNGVSLGFSSALVIGNQILDNSNDGEASGGGGGGGIGVGGNPCGDASCGAEIRDNLIQGNSADYFLMGGGIFANAAGNLKIIGNVIQGNSAQLWGGGIAMINGTYALIENNLIVDNRVTEPSGEGGGVYWSAGGGTGQRINGNTLVDNQSPLGSGMYVDSSGFDVEIANNVVVAYPGSTGIECAPVDPMSPPFLVTNDVFVTGGAEAYAGICLGDDGTNGNISAQPVFLGSDDYRLMPGSPGIDAGTNSYATQETDLSGGPRILDGNGDGIATIDMGAYEYAPDEIFGDGFESSP